MIQIQKIIIYSFMFYFSMGIGCFAYTPLSESPLATKVRPRMFLTPDTLSAIVKSVTTEYRSMYDALKADADELLFLDPVFGSYDVTLVESVMTVALVGIIERERGRPYAVYRDKSILYADFIMNNMDVWTLTSKYSGAAVNSAKRSLMLSVIYDWFFSDLEMTQKQLMHNYIIDIYRGICDDNRDTGTAPVRTSYYATTDWGTYGGRLIHCLAVYGDGLGDEDYIDRSLDAGKKELESEVSKVLTILGGSINPGGWGYSLSGATANWAVTLISVYDLATGSKTLNDPSLGVLNFPNFMAHMSKPGGGLIKIGDTSDIYCLPQYFYGNIKYVNDGRMSLIPFVKGNRIAKYIVDLSPFKTSKTRRWRDLVFYDTTIHSLPVSTLPLVGKYPGVGLLSKRTSWTDPGSLFFTFSNSDQYGGHSSAKQNSFTINYKGAILALNDGNYPAGSSGAPHTKDYYRRTISSNSMLVFDPSETIQQYGREWHIDGGQKYGDYNATIGLGGYSSWNAVEYVQDAFDLTDNNSADTQTEVNDLYTYIQGDATRAYYSEKLEHFTREFLNIGNYFVVYDRVKSKDASYRKSYLLHSLTEPVLDGSESFTCPDSFAVTGKRACQGDTNAGISESYDSTLSTITNGNGRLFSKTLLPVSPVIRKIGGEGYRFWVDDANANISSSSYEDSMTGGWRLEISPATNNLSDHFLHVMEAASSSKSSMVAVEKIDVSSNNMAGALIKDSRQNKVVLFSSAEDAAVVTTPVEYTLKVAANALHLLFNLQQNTLYSIDINGTISNVVSSSIGTLMFNNISDGNFTFTISCNLNDVGKYPDSPELIGIEGEGSKSKLVWALSLDDGGGQDDVIGYNVYRSLDNETYTRVPPPAGDMTTTTSKGIKEYSITPVNGARVFSKVTAVNSAGLESSKEYILPLKTLVYKLAGLAPCAPIAP